MKTAAKLWVAAALVFCGADYATAQAAAGSSKDVTPVVNQTANTAEPVATTDTVTEYRSTRGIPTPSHIEKLLQEGNVTQGLAEFEKFKKTQRRANKFDLLYLEMTIYWQAQMGDPAHAAQYQAKADKLLQQLITDYPNVSDTYLLQITEKSTPEQIVELATKAIEVDPENIGAYDARARALHQLGQTKEACADLEKLPYKGQMPEYWPCKQ